MALNEVEPSALREVFTEVPEVGWADVGGLDEIKQLLIEANRDRHLSLACADMAPFLDRQDVASSAIEFRSATFHFICI